MLVYLTLHDVVGVNRRPKLPLYRRPKLTPLLRAS
jgi:hypothetical protein